MKTKLISALLLVTAFAVSSCKKEDAAVTGPMVVHMSETGASPHRSATVYEEVNLDVQRVEVNVHSPAGDSWVQLQGTPGMYNVLDLAGIDTVLGNAVLPYGESMQVRLVLGNNNSVKINGILYPMNVPSGSESGLKVNVNRGISPDVTLHIYLDFDAAQSVVLDGSGSYHLKPVIHVRY